MIGVGKFFFINLPIIAIILSINMDITMDINKDTTNINMDKMSYLSHPSQKEPEIYRINPSIIVINDKQPNRQNGHHRRHQHKHHHHQHGHSLTLIFFVIRIIHEHQYENVQFTFKCIVVA